MKCAVHTEVDAKGFCRNCGKALCEECARDVRGIIHCEDCLAALVSKPQAVAGGSGSPGTAAVLGIVPGLGAVYNGEYFKAFVHVLIFGGLIGLIDRGRWEALFGMMLATFIIYMPVEAYRTAKAKMLGQPLTNPLSNIGQGQPIGAYVLIAIGALLLISKLDFPIFDYVFDWGMPLAFIAIGVYLIWRRMGGSPPPGPSAPGSFTSGEPR